MKCSQIKQCQPPPPLMQSIWTCVWDYTIHHEYEEKKIIFIIPLNKRCLFIYRVSCTCESKSRSKSKITSIQYVTNHGQCNNVGKCKRLYWIEIASNRVFDERYGGTWPANEFVVVVKFFFPPETSFCGICSGYLPSQFMGCCYQSCCIFFYNLKSSIASASSSDWR